MRRTLGLFLSIVIASGLLVVASGYAVIQPQYWDDLTDNPNLVNVAVSPPYGYFTHRQLGLTDADEKFDSRAALRWATSIVNRDYFVNAVGGSGGLSETIIIQKLQEADNLWHSQISASSGAPSFTYKSFMIPEDASLLGSICGNAPVANGVNEIDICPGINSGGGTVHSVTRLSGQVVTTTEVDMGFSQNYQWDSDIDFYNVALHEFGHFYGLADMYSEISGGGYDCLGGESPHPIMCPDVGLIHLESPQWGDRDGVRWLYPKLVSGQNSFSLSGTVSGSDSGVAQIDSNSLKDLMFVWGDYNSGTGQTTIRAKAIWDINSSTGLGGTVGSSVALTTIAGQTKDVGATLGDITGDTSKRDLVITFVDGVSTFVKYMTLKDITKSGNSFTFGTPVSDFVDPTSGDKGTDVIVFDMIPGGAKEMVVIDSFDSNGLKLFYYYAALLSDGSVAPGSWTQGSSSGTIPLSTEDIGAQVPYPSNRIVTVVDQAPNGGRVKEDLIHFGTGGGILGKITSKNALGRQPVGVVTGLGAGDAINLGEQSYPEQFFSWSDATTGYYFVEWDSRLNSHR